MAVRNKSGEAFELMKKRASYVKANFERKEDIARLTILLNSLPRKEGEALRDVIESGEGPDVDVSFLPKEKQQELVNLAFRLGRSCCVFAGSFSLDKKKAESAELKPQDEIRKQLGNRLVWVEASKAQEFEENERQIASLLAKIQAKTAEKQSRSLTEEEQVYLEKIQADYLAAIKRRSELADGIELNESVRVYKKPKQQPQEW
jgi:hypothetical protein